MITVALSGDYGKPRPALVVQSDRLSETFSIIVCPLTSTLVDSAHYRLVVPPSNSNGLHIASQIMVDKITTVRRDKCGPIIGYVDDATLLTVGRMIALVTGFADG